MLNKGRQRYKKNFNPKRSFFVKTFAALFLIFSRINKYLCIKYQLIILSLKIIVNVRHLIKGKLEGIGIFTAETLKIIVKKNPEIDFVFVFDRDFDEEFIFSKNIKPIILKPKARHPILFKLWYNHRLKKLIQREKPDLLLSPDGFIPLHISIPSLAVIHDLAFEHYPKDFPNYILKYLKKQFPKFARNATRIATVSEFTKNDIAQKYTIDKNKIDVVYNGSLNDYQPIKSKEKIQETRNKYSSGQAYFLYLGSLHPRKNISNLLLAFDIFKSKTKFPHKLLLVGRKMWWTQKMEEAYQNMKFKEDVVFAGHVSTNELKNILGSATALTYLSYFEGFGIPLVEAFNAGIAVITSNTSSLVEVASDAAILCNPFNTEEIAQAMSNIVQDETRRKELIEKGFKRAKNFSWEKSADLLWESILKTLN